VSTTSRPELTRLLLDLLALPCVTGEEGPIADWVVARYDSEPVLRVGDSMVVGGGRSERPLVLLVGHLDVVPPTPADRWPRREDGRIIGRGASDMKSGLAVAMACFEDPVLRAGPYELLLVAYAGEEGSIENNELGALMAADPRLALAGLAIVLEPTDLAVQLGCLGGLHAQVTYSGRAAHSARPWQGENALTSAGRLLADLHLRKPHDVTVDGLRYREVITATQAELVGDAARVEIVDRAPPGRPWRDAPLVSRFLDAVDAPIEAKQAWTDVARLSEAGIPALNYGPGLTAQAHQAGEYVPEDNLVVAHAAISRFLRGGGKVRAAASAGGLR
jgi:succinyl-diaminopimelate desuccinylase